MSLADNESADVALTDFSDPLGFSSWKMMLESQIGFLRSRMSQEEPGHPEGVTFEHIYYDEFVRGDTAAALHLDAPPDASLLLSPEQCARLLRLYVTGGLLFGCLFPKQMVAMFHYWLTQPGGMKSLQVGGLKVDDKPPFKSVKEAEKVGLTIFGAWEQSYPEAAAYYRRLAADSRNVMWRP